jgi:uncharacterized protein YbaR (Trm112 family)
MNYESENISITCRCKSELSVSYARLSGFNESEEFLCPNCGQIHSVRAAIPIMNNQVKVFFKGIDKQPHDLNPEIIHDILSAKGISNLHHANTVLTSCTFFENANLLSREYVEKNGLKQTEQYTDGLDKKYGIFNDIFMDTIDIHDRASSKNHYGPILFVFPLSILKRHEVHFIRITKTNPSKWNDNIAIADRYYTSEEEFRDNYRTGDFDSMIIFPYVDGKFNLNGTLSYIKVDNPKLIWNDNKKELHVEAIEVLKKCAVIGKLNNIGICIKVRKCDSSYCRCINQYKYNTQNKKYFR